MRSPAFDQHLSLPISVQSDLKHYTIDRRIPRQVGEDLAAVPEVLQRIALSAVGDPAVVPEVLQKHESKWLMQLELPQESTR